MMRAIVVIPTYNEAENIVAMIQAIRAQPVSGQLDILVVDSNSPDGTAARVEELKRDVPRLEIYRQPRKLGLGRAYWDAFDHLKRLPDGSYDAVLTMDADFSHNPRYLEAMLQELACNGMVIGSRYVPGGGLENWSGKRIALSWFANSYARLITGIPLKDLTSGFHCMRREVLEAVTETPIRADGYAFLMELKFRASLLGFDMAEIPVVVADRTKGRSKISKRVIVESAWTVWRLLFQKLRRPAQDARPGRIKILR